MPQLDIKAEAARLRQMYTDSPRTKLMHLLLLGSKGVGKTSLITTCPRPILIHSFDPGGVESISREIEGAEPGWKVGDIIPDTRFEVDGMNSPRAYKLWQSEFNRLVLGGFFSGVGTYVIDSLTTLATSVTWQIMAKEGRTPPGAHSGEKLDKEMGMRIQDWGTFLNTFLMLSRALSALPCHTILTGHIEKTQDSVTGAYVKRLLVAGKSQDQIPINIPELYILQSTPTGERKLLTANDGSGFEATTRMGRGRFEILEKPDLRYLLQKAGYPHEDKESIS